MKDTLKDVQSEPDERMLEIQKVGIKGIRYPIYVLDKLNKYQHTIATIEIGVDLPHHFKGTHMSRFIEIINSYRKGIAVKNFKEILSAIKTKLHAKSSHLTIEFPYFIEKKAPVSKSKSLMSYNCVFSGTLGENFDFFLEVNVPVTTVCPCSKSISKEGAHNQRGNVKVKIRFDGFIWIEDIVELIETSASCDIYAILKRADEKYVTEKAFANPMFVEDVVREVALKLMEDKKIIWFSVEAENFESIHNHNAYAYIERRRDGIGRFV
ncbi:MAG: GTP cyclohydrolase FolE2 [Proteobacteria bacterium]|nr:GTP cyclohydrolase FolE2 [Pseudomonadota bacterium]